MTRFSLSWSLSHCYSFILFELSIVNFFLPVFHYNYISFFFLLYLLPAFANLSHLTNIDATDRRWVGMWWGGFLVCGLLLLIVAVPFFSFPKVRFFFLFLLKSFNEKIEQSEFYSRDFLQKNIIDILCTV